MDERRESMKMIAVIRQPGARQEYSRRFSLIRMHH